MLSEEDFLSDIYSEYIEGDEYEQHLAADIDNNIRWRIPGSTIKAKYFIANSLKRLHKQEHPNIYKISIYLTILNEITRFHKSPYIKGDGFEHYV